MDMLFKLIVCIIIVLVVKNIISKMNAVKECDRLIEEGEERLFKYQKTLKNLDEEERRLKEKRDKLRKKCRWDK